LRFWLADKTVATPVQPTGAREAISPPPVVAPFSAPPRKPARRRWSWRAALLLAFGAMAAIIVVQLGRETVEIECDDPYVKVTIRNGGKEIVILDEKSKQEAILTAGNSAVELKGEKETVTLEAKEFTLKRGKKVIVSVKRTELKGEKEKAAGGVPDLAA